MPSAISKITFFINYVLKSHLLKSQSQTDPVRRGRKERKEKERKRRELMSCGWGREKGKKGKRKERGRKREREREREREIYSDGPKREGKKEKKIGGHVSPCGWLREDNVIFS
jgi:hypothetical protein